MAESSLSLSYNDLMSEIGFFMGFGRGAAYNDVAFTLQQQQTIDSIIRSGLREFYYPTAAEGESSAHSWSFLRPMATITIGSSARTAPLPDDYGGLEGRIAVNQVGQPGNMFWPVEFVGIGQVYQAETNLPTTTGRPQIACEEPLKGTSPQAGQKWQLHLFPLTDSSYTLKFQYYINPDYLTTMLPYPYGGMQHAQTIRAACLMAAEQYVDDRSQVNAMKFQERLRASIDADRRQKPQTIGYNGDRSDAIHTLWGTPGWPFWHYTDQIMVNGTQYALLLAMGLAVALGT